VAESKATAREPRSQISMARESDVVRRSLRVAALVCTLLVAIHYGDRALAGALGPTGRLKTILTCCVPDGFATYAAVQTIREHRRVESRYFGWLSVPPSVAALLPVCK